MKYDSWDDKQGGGKRSKLSVVIENFQFVGGRDGGGGGAPAGPDQPEASTEPPPPRPPVNRPPAAPAPRAASAGAAPAGAVEPPFGESQEIKEDDIPFQALTLYVRAAPAALQ